MHKFNQVFLLFVLCSMFYVLCHAEDFVYDAKGKRDPFVPLVGVAAAPTPKGLSDIKSIADIKLEGIVYDEKGVSMVIINGALLKEGSQVGVILIEKIDPKKVILRIKEKKYEVPLGAQKGGEQGEDKKIKN